MRDVNETILAIERAFKHKLTPSEYKDVVRVLEDLIKQTRREMLTEPNAAPDDLS